MKSQFCMILFSIIFNACSDDLCLEDSTKKFTKADQVKTIDNQSIKDHGKSVHKWHLLNDWLNRKSMGHFIKKHISLEAGINGINDNVLNNDTFIP
jgi:hypothetical protein